LVYGSGPIPSLKPNSSCRPLIPDPYFSSCHYSYTINHIPLPYSPQSTEVHKIKGKVRAICKREKKPVWRKEEAIAIHYNKERGF